MEEVARWPRRPAGWRRRREREKRALQATWAAVATVPLFAFVLFAAGFIPRAEAVLRPPPVVTMPCGTTWEQAFAQIDGLNVKRSTLRAHPEIAALLPDPQLQPATLFAVSDRAYVNLLSDPSAQVTAELDNFEARMPLGKAASMWLFRALPAPYSAEDLRGLRSAPTALSLVTEMKKYSLGFQPIHISGVDNVLIDDLLPTVQATPVLASYKICESWLHVIEQYLVPAPAFNVSRIPDPVPGGLYSPQQNSSDPQPFPSALEVFTAEARARMPRPWEWRRRVVVGAAVGGSLAAGALAAAAFFALRCGRRARDRSLEDGRKAGIELGLAEASRALSHGIPLTGGLSGGLQLPGSTVPPRGGRNNNDDGNGGNHFLGAKRDSNLSGGSGGAGGGGYPVRSPRLSGSSAASASAAAASASAAAAPGSNADSGSMRRGKRFLRLLRHSPKDGVGVGAGAGAGAALPSSLSTIQGSGHSHDIADDDDGVASPRGGAALQQQRGSSGGASSSAAAASPTTAAPGALFPDLSSLGTGWEIDGAAVRILTDAAGLPRKLGEGGFGSVFLAEMDGATPVAVKIVSNQQPREVRRFVQEVSILKSLRHTNVVQFLGAFFSADRIALLTEFLPRGDLHRLLGRDTSGQLGWYRRGRAIALDVVRGIVYMHSRKPPVAHLDLKPANCLLGRDWTCKVADVGLAKVLCREDTQVSLEGTFEWAAPEVLSGERVCEKADLFALSVILYEIVTGEAPRNRQLREIRCPEECPPEVKDIIERCRLRDPQLRPTAKEVYDVLNATPPTGIHHPMGGSTAMFASVGSVVAVGGGSVFGRSIVGAGGGRVVSGGGSPAAAEASLGGAPSSSSDGAAPAAAASLQEARSSGSVAEAAVAAAAAAAGSGSGGGSGGGAPHVPPTPFSSQGAAAAAPVPAPPRRVPARLPPSAFSSTPPN